MGKLAKGGSYTRDKSGRILGGKEKSGGEIDEEELTR